MAKLRTLAPRLTTFDSNRVKPMLTADVRMSGRRLQERRKRVWQRDPNCARCGCLTVYPWGFELDHRIPLHQGGEDTEENTQILCNGPEGCHLIKTREDASPHPSTPLVNGSACRSNPSSDGLQGAP